MKDKILIIDDDQDIRLTLSEQLEDDGFDVTAICGSDELEALEIESYSSIFLDIKLGAENGIDILKSIKEEHANIPVIMITGHGTVTLAKEAFQIGAYDFLEKPLRLINIRKVLRNAVEKSRLLKQVKGNQSAPVAVSSVMKKVFVTVKKLSHIAMPVFITGESGSGKEIVASMLHSEGKRFDKPFVAVNAASLPANLAEDELFGHKKGAFTGADSNRDGAILTADGGTLFLDEIADLDLTVQAKLLRFLETQTFSPLGSDEDIRVDVRIVAATHKNISEKIADGSFREDLWFRLSAFVVDVPALRNRKDDIVPLAEHFLAAVSVEFGMSYSLSAAAKSQLEGMQFKGNVRELKHIITRAAFAADSGTIAREHISGSQNASNASLGCRKLYELSFKDARTAFEKEYFSYLLTETDGSVTESANRAGMAQGNLSRKLKELGLR